MGQRTSVTIRFEGDSGDGIISMGKTAARTAARMGYHVYTFSTFLAVVRGGQVTFQMRIGSEPLLSQGDDPDILVALNRQAVRDNAQGVRAGGIILHPPLNGASEPMNPAASAVEVAYEEIAVSETGSARSKNMVAAGVLLGVLGLEESQAAEVVREMFAGKGREVADNNTSALGAGFAEGRRLGEQAPALRIPNPNHPPRMLLSGNEAAALGALAGGVRFFAGYPITPASEIMEWLAKELPRIGGTMVQVEDEIASLAMVIGASYGGVKAMTATSGPGLSLMIELLGLAGMAEIPVVVVDVQRAGPSTGMPTKEAQGDLFQAVHGTHGEVPRVVLAPQTVADCFEQTARAVNIAHQFHIPVLVLSSQSLSHRQQTINVEDLQKCEQYQEPLWKPEDAKAQGGEFVRFRQTEDGLPSLRSIPGTPGGMYRAGGLEHDETGNPDFDPEVRSRMVERRRKRMHAIDKAFEDVAAQDMHCAGDTPLGVMSWGTTAPVVREVIQNLEPEGYEFSYFLPRMLWPMPDLAIRRFLSSGIKLLFVCELNATHQFAEMLRARFTADLLSNNVEVVSVTKDDGLPFTPGEITTGIMKALEERKMTIQKTENKQ